MISKIVDIVKNWLRVLFFLFPLGISILRNGRLILKMILLNKYNEHVYNDIGSGDDDDDGGVFDYPSITFSDSASNIIQQSNQDFEEYSIDLEKINPFYWTWQWLQKYITPVKIKHDETTTNIQIYRYSDIKGRKSIHSQ